MWPFRIESEPNWSRNDFERATRNLRSRPQDWIGGLVLLTAVLLTTHPGSFSGVAYAQAQEPEIPKVTVRPAPAPSTSRPARQRRRPRRRTIRRAPAPPARITPAPAPKSPRAPVPQPAVSRPATPRSTGSRTVRTRESAFSLNNRAYRLQKQGRHADAEPLLRRALELDPSHAYARYNLGWCLLEQGKASEALPHLKITAAQQPGRWEPQQRLSEAYSRLGDRKRAAVAAEKARSLRGDRRQGALKGGVPTGDTQPVEKLAGGAGPWRESTDRREDAWFQEVRTPRPPDKEAAVPGLVRVGNALPTGERDE